MIEQASPALRDTPSRRQRVAQALFPQLAVLGKALASPQRLMLVDLLCQAPRSVEALAAQSGMSVANTSQHLHQLRAARLLESERQGQHVVYRLASEAVGEFYVAFRGLAASRLAEMDRITRELVRPDGPVDTRGILAKISRGEVTLLDVRPAEEFAAGHLPGALCIPVEELPERHAEIPRDAEVVAYCRGPYCTMAEEAVEFLRARGHRAQALDLGIMELRRFMPIHSGGPAHRSSAEHRAAVSAMPGATHGPRSAAAGRSSAGPMSAAASKKQKPSKRALKSKSRRTP